MSQVRASEEHHHRTKQRVSPWLVGFVMTLVIAVIVTGGLLVSRRGVAEARGETEPDSIVVIAEKATKERPDDPEVWRQLAYAYQQAGQHREALREYARVLSQDPNDLASLYNCGLIHLGLGESREGESELLAVIERAPTHALAAKALGEHYARTGRFDRILGAVASAADAHPELADLQYLAGLGYEKAGRRGEASGRYRAALLLVPDLGEARDGLARLEKVE